MPLLWISLAFLAGIPLGKLLDWRLQTWLFLAALVLGIYLVARGLAGWLHRGAQATHPLWRWIDHLPYLPRWLAPVLPLFLILGAARYQVAQPALDPDSVAWYNDQRMAFVIEGTVAGPADNRDTFTYLRVQVDQLRPANDTQFKPVQGLVLAKIPPNGDWRYGDRVHLEGQLETPVEYEDFSYRDYLARQGIYSSFSCGKCMACVARVPDKCIRLIERDQGNPWLTWIYQLKERALQTIYRLYPDPEASLLAGILLGVESGIPAEVQQAFRDTGTAHIIAISGFNMTIIGGLFATIFLRWLGKPRRFLAAFLTTLVLALYTVLVGASASVVRAAILGGFALFGRQLGRRQNGLNSLATIAALMTLFDPDQLWEVGFQLSFMATLGLVLYADLFGQAFVGWAGRHLPTSLIQRIAKPAGEYFLFTLAAQLTVLPVTVYYFRNLSLVSLIANPLVLPPQPLVMILGGLSVVPGMLFLPIGKAISYLAWPFVAYTIRMVEILAGLPSAAIMLGNLSLIVVIAFYSLLFGWPWAGKRLRTSLAPHLSGWTAHLAAPTLLAAGALAVLVWQQLLTAPDGRLHMALLEVDQGNALLIQTPEGRSLLIDGGSSPSQLSDALGRRLPLLQRQLDFLVVASADAAYIEALPRSIERFPPGSVLWAGEGNTNQAETLLSKLNELHIPIQPAQTGQALDLGQGATLRILATDPGGSALWLEWKNFRALIPIGLDSKSLDQLQNNHSLPTTSALLVESSPAPSNPLAWLGHWRPQVILVSAGPGGANELSAEMLEAMDGYTVLRTDQNGWIELITDGNSLWLNVEKP